MPLFLISNPLSILLSLHAQQDIQRFSNANRYQDLLSHSLMHKEIQKTWFPQVILFILY